MNADGLAFVVLCLTGVLVIGVVWQLFGMHLDRQADKRRRRRLDEHARRWRDHI